ncbi:MAG: hypothetical protein Q8R39_04935 [bacterium]|nr:hypothetical protein [bacterium]MDZ4284786.1 hypothetical protein [Patescibacteria group bacterium]
MSETPRDFTAIIISTTYTVSDVHERIALMRRFLEEAFFAGGATPTRERLEEFLDVADAEAETRSALRSWLDAWAGALSRESLYSTLRAVESDVSALPVLGIITPVRLPDEETVRLGAWVREYVDARALIDFHTDPAAVGGCRLIWGGREREFSFGYFVEKHRDEIVEEIGAVFAKAQKANVFK